MSEEVNNSVDAAQAAQINSESNPGLQIADLVAVVQLIGVVSQRGAIQPNEMTQVGGLYTRLVAFLESNGAITRNPPAAQQSAPTQGN